MTCEVISVSDEIYPDGLQCCDPQNADQPRFVHNPLDMTPGLSGDANMHQRDPKTESINSSDARAQWDAVIDRVCRDQRRVLIEENGMPVAAIVSVDDYRRPSQLELLHEATVEREVANAVTAARAQRRKDKRTARAS
jgi:prevent-host-death family protein